MALKQCKECGKEVSDKAKKCPNCGAPVPKSVGVFGILLTLFVGFIFFKTCSNMEGGSGSASSPTSATSYTPPEPQTPPLEVQSWRCDKEHGYAYVRGEVKNVSNRKLEHVEAVGTFRTKSGELVKSSDSLIDYNPIMPGQTSPFSTGTSDNPQMERCELGFKFLLGGGEIDYKIKEKKKQADR